MQINLCQKLVEQKLGITVDASPMTSKKNLYSSTAQKKTEMFLLHATDSKVL